MTAIVIILIIALVVIMWAGYNRGQIQEESELDSFLRKIHNEIFPNGKRDIDKGTKVLLRILNNKIDEKTAQNIFVKSSSICYTTSMNGSFNREILKQHLAPYALKYFSESTLTEFYEYILSKNEKASILDNLRDLSNSSNPKGTGSDVMPEGYGEYGLDITNPIPTSSIADSYFYLSRLRTENGSEIAFDRIGSMDAPNISHDIDAYAISANGQELTTLYICPYNKKTSNRAPIGFILN